MLTDSEDTAELNLVDWWEGLMILGLRTLPSMKMPSPSIRYARWESRPYTWFMSTFG